VDPDVAQGDLEEVAGKVDVAVAVGGQDAPARLPQLPDQVAPDEPSGAGDQRLHASRFRSASTIIRTSSGKPTSGVQPSFRRALAGFPQSVFPSAGRKSALSTTTYFFQERPTWSNAISQNSRTVWFLPVATTKSSGAPCCRIIHIART